MDELSLAEKRFVSNINNYTVLLVLFISIVWLSMSIMVFYPYARETASLRNHIISTPIIISVVAIFFIRSRQLLMKIGRDPSSIDGLSKSEKRWTGKGSFPLRVLGIGTLLFGLAGASVGTYGLIFVQESSFGKLNVIRIIIGSITYALLGWLIYKSSTILSKLFNLQHRSSKTG